MHLKRDNIKDSKKTRYRGMMKKKRREGKNIE